MKAGIHPNYHPITVRCSCGVELVTGSVLDADSLNIEVCNSCHPYFTGKQKLVAAGMVERFNKRFGRGLGQPKSDKGDSKQ